jgi:hypothetical protein
VLQGIDFGLDAFKRGGMRKGLRGQRIWRRQRGFGIRHGGDIYHIFCPQGLADHLRKPCQSTAFSRAGGGEITLRLRKARFDEFAVNPTGGITSNAAGDALRVNTQQVGPFVERSDPSTRLRPSGPGGRYTQGEGVFCIGNEQLGGTFTRAGSFQPGIEPPTGPQGLLHRQDGGGCSIVLEQLNRGGRQKLVAGGTNFGFCGTQLRACHRNAGVVLNRLGDELVKR